MFKNPFERESKQRENSSESLERIHTFSLKNSFPSLNHPPTEQVKKVDIDLINTKKA